MRQGDKVIAGRKVLADFYLHPQTSQMKRVWKRVIPLDPGEYEVSLYAVDSWGAESNVLNKSITVQ